jgi:hypothetical protein
MRIRRPQPATVVALIALALALSGTSFASVTGDHGGPEPSCQPRTLTAAGLCFDSAPSGPLRGVRAAADACAAAGGYLPRPGELALAPRALRREAEPRGLFTDSYRIADAGRLALTTVLTATGRRSVIEENLAAGRPLAVYPYICSYRPQP